MIKSEKKTYIFKNCFSFLESSRFNNLNCLMTETDPGIKTVEKLASILMYKFEIFDCDSITIFMRIKFLLIILKIDEYLYQ